MHCCVRVYVVYASACSSFANMTWRSWRDPCPSCKAVNVYSSGKLCVFVLKFSVCVNCVFELALLESYEWCVCKHTNKIQYLLSLYTKARTQTYKNAKHSFTQFFYGTDIDTHARRLILFPSFLLCFFSSLLLLLLNNKPPLFCVACVSLVSRNHHKDGLRAAHARARVDAEKNAKPDFTFYATCQLP